MGEEKFSQKCITIRKDQDDFIRSQRYSFKLSKFVQEKLDEYKGDLAEFRKNIGDEK